MELIERETNVFAVKEGLSSVLTPHDPLLENDSVSFTGGGGSSEVVAFSVVGTGENANTGSDIQAQLLENLIVGQGGGSIAAEPGQTNRLGTDLLTGESEKLVSPQDIIVFPSPDLTGDYYNVSQTSLTAGGTLNSTYRIKNIGLAAAGASTVKFYLSTNSIISSSDYFLGSSATVALGSGGNTGNLTKTLTLPAAGNAYWNANGDATYYLGMIVDANNNVSELNEGNNANTGILIDKEAVPVKGTKVADLSGKYFNVVTEPLDAADTFNVEYQLQNTGPGKAAASTAKFYLSTNSTISTADYLLGSATVNSLAAGASTAIATKSLTLPSATNTYWDTIGDGTYYIGMIVDANNSVSETNEANNSNTGLLKDRDDVIIDT